MNGSLLQSADSSKDFTQSEEIEPITLDVAEIYQKNAQFIWRSLFRMGISEADLPDVMQEVLLVVHRRLHTYDGKARLSTWLFGICLRVAATARRTRRRRREEPMNPDMQPRILVDSTDPERLVLAREAKRQLEVALDALPPEKRVVFVMFELEGVPCGEIAELLGVPKGTVFSRLSMARQMFLRALGRLNGKNGELPAMGAER
jgi:RNA polymerase sigma-70 factor, ECF subfamily